MINQLGKFEIKSVLGQGAMGEVYLGVDPSIGREVAIKTILPSAATGADAKDRFAREAKAAGVLNHPNLVTIYEFGEDQGVLFIAMELVKGHDLEDLMRRQALSHKEGLEVLAQVCDGLAFAHANRIVHRDIKPANIRVLKDGKRLHAKVMDFGVARVGDSGMTATGMVMGTVSYMAPEYIRTGNPDPRNDLFAVGVMLYEILSGRKPFSGDTTPTILYKIVNEAPDPLDLSQLHGISPAIRSVLDRALDKDPEHRHQSAEELAKALRAAKDPTWNGRAADGRAADATVHLPSAPPTQQVPEAAAALPQPPALPTTLIPADRRAPASHGTGLLVSLAALALIAVVGGGWGVWKWKSGRAAPASPGVTTSGAESTVAASNPMLPVNAGSELAPSKGAKVSAPPPPRGTESAGASPAQEERPQTLPAPQEATDELASLSGAERRNLGLGLLSDGSRIVGSDPAKALQILKRAIAANPYDPRPYALSAAVLYQQERYDECMDVLRRARAANLTRSQLVAADARFRLAMDKDSFNHRLERALD